MVATGSATIIERTALLCLDTVSPDRKEQTHYDSHLINLCVSMRLKLHHAFQIKHMSLIIYYVCCSG